MKFLLLFLVALSCWVSDAAPRTDPMYDYNVCMQINQERYPYRTAHHMCMNRGKRDDSAAESTEEVREKRAVELPDLQAYENCMAIHTHVAHRDEDTAHSLCENFLGLRGSRLHDHYLSNYDMCMVYQRQEMGEKYDEKEAQKRCGIYLPHKRDESAAESTEEVREKRAGVFYEECKKETMKRYGEKYNEEALHVECGHLLRHRPCPWDKHDVSAEITEKVREKRYGEEYDLCMLYQRKKCDEAEKKCANLPHKREVSTAGSTEDVREKRYGEEYDLCMLYQRKKCDEAEKQCANLPHKREVSAAEFTEEVREERAAEISGRLVGFERCLNKTITADPPGLCREPNCAYDLCKHLLIAKREVSTAESPEEVREERSVRAYMKCMNEEFNTFKTKYDGQKAHEKCGHLRQKQDIDTNFSVADWPVWHIVYHSCMPQGPLEQEEHFAAIIRCTPLADAAADSVGEGRGKRSSEDDPMYDYNVCMQINQQRYPYRTAHHMCMNRGKKREIAQPRDIYPPLNPRHPWGI